MDAQCGQCGIVARAEETRPGDRFRRAGDLERALGCWAREEGHDSADDFVASSFLDGDTGRIYERIRDGERVETNFDVLAFLFPELALASSIPLEPSAAAEPAPSSPAASLEAPSSRPRGSPASEPVRPAPDESPVASVSPPATASPADEIRCEPWAPMLPLVSVMVADGRVHPAEEAFLQRILTANQCPPVPAAFVRVHRPDSVPVPPDPRARERMIEAMIHLVHVDRLRDGTEIRVVEEYARAWGIAAARVTHWDDLYRRRYATGLRRLWLILQSTFTKD